MRPRELASTVRGAAVLAALVARVADAVRNDPASYLQSVDVGADGSPGCAVHADTYVDNTHTAVVVIGGGLAGLSAALEARRASSGPVILVEAAMDLGGNSAKASSGMNWLSPYAGDSIELFEADTLRSGGGLSDEALVAKLVVESDGAKAFLEAHGVELPKRSQCGAHSVPRTYRNEPPGPNVGNVIVRALAEAVRADPGIDVRTGVRAERLLTAQDCAGCPSGTGNAEEDRGAGVSPDVDVGAAARVCGVIIVPVVRDEGATAGAAGLAGSTREATGVGEKDEAAALARARVGATAVRAHAVVLATGGFAASKEHMRRWAPALAHLPTTNGPTASGDGIDLGTAAGASLADMSQVQVHPTALVNLSAPAAKTKWLAPEAMRAAGGLLLDREGRRFVDELGTRAAVTAAMRKLEGERAALVLGEAAAESFGVSTLRFYAHKGLAAEVHGTWALAQHLGVDVKALVAELQRHDALVDRAAEGEAVRDGFGKTVFHARALVLNSGGAAGAHAGAEAGVADLPPEALGSDTFFVMQVTPALHYCMGGLRIDENAQVLAAGAGGVPIAGLFAAGEVTGGVHGANRLAGNSLLECVVFGRAAGRSAAAGAGEAVSMQ